MLVLEQVDHLDRAVRLKLCRSEYVVVRDAAQVGVSVRCDDVVAAGDKLVCERRPVHLVRQELPSCSNCLMGRPGLEPGSDGL